MKISKLIIAVLLLGLLVLVWWPIWAMFSGSFFSVDEVSKYVAPVFSAGDGFASWPLLPAYPTLRPLVALFLDTPEFFTMFWNSCILAFPQIIGQVLVAAPMAWAISVLRAPGQSFYTVFILYL